MSSLLDRVAAFFVEPPRTDDPDRPAPPPAADGFAAPVADVRHAPAANGFAAPVADDRLAPPPTPAPFAVVLGAHAVPVAAACAGELRAQVRAAAALLCVWGGADPSAGATTPAARRLAARLGAGGLPATACGRLAWVALDADPEAAARQARQARTRADAPAVLAIAAPRPPALEPLIADADVVVAVLPADADDALRALARSALPARATSRIVPPLPPGPARWTAMAGLGRLRALREGERR